MILAVFNGPAAVQYIYVVSPLESISDSIVYVRTPRTYIGVTAKQFFFNSSAFIGLVGYHKLHLKSTQH